MTELWSLLHGLEEGAGEGLRLDIAGTSLHLEGAAGESLVLSDAAGTTVYADLDGDGVIDHISSVHGDGGYDVFTADPHRAAWGLAAGSPGNDTSEPPLSWGLGGFLPPEIGAEQGSGTAETPSWQHIEHG